MTKLPTKPIGLPFCIMISKGLRSLPKFEKESHEYLKLLFFKCGLFTLLASAPCLLPDALHLIPYIPTDLTCLGISALAVSQYRDGCIGTLVIFGLTRCKNVDFIKVVVHFD